MPPRPTRLLVVCPSWLGDVVMATPTFRRLRAALPGAFIGALLRPGLDELIAGTDFFDELHIDRAQGVMGPKLVATRLRPRRYDAAVLLTNSFSTALITRLAFIPRRIGYDRDGRGLLLTDRLKAPRRDDGRWACVPAVEYYLRLADAVIAEGDSPSRAPQSGGSGGALAAATRRLELSTTPEQEAAADRLLAAAGVASGQPFAVLNPGANNPDKRWPAERFGALARHLVNNHRLHVLINGSPAESELAETVRAHALAADPALAASVACLPRLGGGIGSLKAVLRRAAILITNDTGPRHIAAAFGTPTVTLFGPTDPRWTTLPAAAQGARAARIDLVADPTLPPEEIADDHPDRCRIDRIATADVLAAADSLLAAAAGGGAMDLGTGSTPAGSDSGRTPGRPAPAS